MISNIEPAGKDSQAKGENQYGPLVIRRFEPRDLKQVLELDREVFGGYDPEVFTSFYEYHPQTVLVAEHHGEVVGFIIGFKHTPLEGRIFWLAVRPGYQSQGIGRRLMTTMLEIFRRLGAISATLEVRMSNRKAQGLYASLQFIMDQIIPGYYSNGEAAIIMRRGL
jgi:ribosomal-protein-alanine N-acetyltransferase